MVLSSLLYIVSAEMWLIVKIAVKFWIPIFLEVCILPPYLFLFFSFILLDNPYWKTSKQRKFVWHKACI